MQRDHLYKKNIIFFGQKIIFGTTKNFILYFFGNLKNVGIFLAKILNIISIDQKYI